jgi:ACR3 family arsenite transporter
MSAQCGVAAKQAAGVSMGFFERYLSLWVVLCIVAGILLGQWFPAAFQALGRIEYAQVNLPVGLLIWVMIVPMLMKIDFASISEVKDQKASIGITLFVNWAIKPFTMAALGWLFIRHVFAPWLPAEQLDSYIAGLILLGAAPCTAMVFVWSNLCRGNANFTISQVALNDLVMVFAFAPIVAFLLGVSAIPVPWDTLLLSVVMYIVIPLAIAQGLRKHFLRGGEQAFKQAAERIAPFTIMALLATLVLLFAFRARPSSSSR